MIGEGKGATALMDVPPPVFLVKYEKRERGD